MAILTYYRGVAFIKNYFCVYYARLFRAYQRGALQLTNGFQEIKFSSEPGVIKRVPQDYRQPLPYVLIGPVRAEYIYRSVAKDFLREPGATEEQQYRIYGGDIRLTMEMTVWGDSQEERDNLVDIVCLYAAHPDAKDFFLKHNIVVEKPPSMSGEKEVAEPGIDHPVFTATVTLPLIGCWQIKTEIGYRFEELFLDIETEVTL